MEAYIHDSASKQVVREKWVEYIKVIKEIDNNPLSIITLPSNEFQELRLYADQGLIEAAEDEKNWKVSH